MNLDDAVKANEEVDDDSDRCEYCGTLLVPHTEYETDEEDSGEDVEITILCCMNPECQNYKNPVAEL